MSSKKENKKEAKERQRLERKEMKEREKAEIAERKRMRSVIRPMCVLTAANGPLNLDRQCGVINDKGLPCMRSLTCKTHTVGSKRAVEGRTRPYDELYIEWQRINNPNFKEPAPRKDKAAREEEKRQKNRGDEARKKIKKPKPVGASVETLGADEDESEEMEALIRATRYAGRKVHSTARARLGGNTVTAFPAVIPRREVQYPPQSAPADANPAGCLAIWQSGRQEQLRVGQLLASALATRKANAAPSVDDKRGPLFGKGLGVQLNSVQVQS
jgi:SAGA-associated factor 73